MKKYSILCKLIAQCPSSFLDVLGRYKFGNKLLKIKDITKDGGPLELNSFIYGQHSFTDFQMQKLLRGKSSRVTLPQKEIWDEFPIDDVLAKFLAIDLASYHADDIHVKVDRASMANSLEVREPFLDQNIVEFAQGMPTGYKLKMGAEFNSKAILRKILYKYIDRSMIDRPKMGFGVPLSIWLKNDLKDLVETSFDRKLLIQRTL